MRRALALLGAVLLVAVAVVVRGVIDDDSDGNGGPGDDADLVVACIPELEEACSALDGDVRIESPEATIAHADEVDAWVTFDPWPEMAGFTLGQDFPGDVVGVAGSRLRLLARTDRLGDCAEPVTWTCAVDTVGDDALLPTARSALRALVLGQAAADFFGSPDVAANDLELDPDLAGRLGALGSPSTDPLRDIRDGIPAAKALGALDAQLGPLGNRLESFTVSPSGTPVTVGIVVAGPRAERVATDAGFVRALADDDWVVDPNATTTGLPSAGVLVALLQEVSP